MSHIDYIGPDGQAWPSATALTHLLPADWCWAWYKAAVEKEGYAGWQKCKAQSEEGMKIGTEVHNQMETLITGKKFLPAPSEIAVKLAQRLYDEVHPKIADYVAIEQHVIANAEKTHGTADLIVRLENRTGLWIGDWKTSYTKDELAHPIQLAVYALGWNEEHPDQIIDQGFIARIDKKSKNLNVKIDEYQGLKFYFPIVRSLRSIWELVNKQGPWER